MEEEEAKRIAEMGKPILGEHPKLEVIIEESYEFKVSIVCQDSIHTGRFSVMAMIAQCYWGTIGGGGGLTEFMTGG